MSRQQPVYGAGFAVPQVFPDGQIDLATVRAVAAQAEALGYESLWTQEQILGPAVSLEPVSLLTYLAAISGQIRLGVSVIVLPQRNPVQLAKQLATVDVLSGGRLTVGVGLGSDRHFPAFGISPEKRVRRFLECLAVMDALWTQDAADFDGEFFQLNGATMRPKPIQTPRPPVWFGARTEPALRRAVLHGDGWMGPGSSSEQDFAQHIEHLRQFLDEAGRDPATFTLSKRVYLAVDDDRVRAERRLREWFAHNYGSADMANRVALWGPADEVHDRIEGLIEAGAQHLLLNPVFDYDEHLDALQMFARQG